MPPSPVSGPPPCRPRPGRSPSRGKRGPRGSSTAISAPKALDALNALIFADHRDTPLNTSWTAAAQGSVVHAPGPTDKAKTDAFRRTIQDAIKAVARRFNLPVAYIIVLENPPSGGPGLHAHVLTHGPQNDVQHAAYRAALQAECERRFRWDSQRPATAFKPLKIRPERIGFLSAHLGLGYNVKGADETFAEAVFRAPFRCAFDRRHLFSGAQGTIHGQRLTISHSIGPTARREAGYRDQATLADLFKAAREWHAASIERLRAHSETQRAPAACLTGPGEVPGHPATPTLSATEAATARPPGECSAAAAEADRIARHFGSARSPRADINVCISSQSGRSGIFVPQQHRRRKASPMQTGPPSLDEYAGGDSLDPEGNHFDPERCPQAPPPPATTKLVSAFIRPSIGFLGPFLEQALLDHERQRAEAAENRDTL